MKEHGEGEGGEGDKTAKKIGRRGRMRGWGKHNRDTDREAGGRLWREERLAGQGLGQQKIIQHGRGTQ